MYILFHTSRQVYIVKDLLSGPAPWLFIMLNLLCLFYTDLSELTIQFIYKDQRFPLSYILYQYKLLPWIWLNLTIYIQLSMKLISHYLQLHGMHVYNSFTRRLYTCKSIFFLIFHNILLRSILKDINVIEMTASILHNNQNCKELGPIKWDNFIMFIITCNFQTEKKMGFTWYIIFSPNELKIWDRLKKSMPFSLPYMQHSIPSKLAVCL